jgi:hypothetical protein
MLSAEAEAEEHTGDDNEGRGDAPSDGGTNDGALRDVAE